MLNSFFSCDYVKPFFSLLKYFPNHSKQKYTITLYTTIGLIFSLPSTANSQVIPDSTLPQNSTVNLTEFLTEINGGTTVGNNLFHSFQQFSIPASESVNFNNADNIANIFSRVTGNSVSNINGLLSTNGTANLFLLNPNGIVFGENAFLNVGGSFVVTTADSFIFNNDSFYSAIEPQEPPLLTVNLPVGLQYGANPGDVRVIDIGGGVGELLGAPNETIALLGGDVTISNSAIISPIEGSITLEMRAVENGILSVVENEGKLRVESPSDIDGKNISISGVNSFLDTSDTAGTGGGDIVLQGKNIEVKEGAGFFLGSSGEFDGGDVIINASESVEFNDGGASTTTGLFDAVDDNFVTTGSSGDITINTPRLTLNRGGRLAVDSQTLGDAGTIRIDANEIELKGVNDFGFSSEIFSGAFGSGAGGNIIIDTDSLLVRDGAVISSQTQGLAPGGDISINGQNIEIFDTSTIFAGTFGIGDGGNLDINAESLLLNESVISVSSFGEGNGGSISLSGQNIELSSQSQISATTSGVGDGGSISLNGQNIELSSQSQISATTFGEGNGGTVDINTANLLVDSSQISTGTSGAGDGGEISVSATDTISLNGQIVTERNGEEIVSRGGIIANAVSLSEDQPGTGSGGSVEIIADKLMISDGATISASNFSTSGALPPGEGGAGNINVSANSISLDDNAIITAEANAGNEGNISLSAENILLRDQSQITTNARKTATGGNIFIDTDTMVAFNNSDITANAVANFAGTVTINATGILGTEARAQLTPQSDITATSELGAEFNGVVDINNSNSEKRLSVAVLPENIVDPTGLITAVCPTSDENSLAMTGNGGIPDSPYSSQSLSTTWYDLRPVKQEEKTVASTPPLLQEASATMINAEGELELVALTSLSSHRWVKSSCPVKS